MKRWIAFALAAFLLLPFSAFAEIKTVIHTLKQPFGGSQSPDDARTAGIARAKREALEQFGTYIESTTVVKNASVDRDEILALTAGVTKSEVIKQKNYTDGDAFGLEITVKVELDSAVLESSLKRLLEDRNHLKDLKAAREREKGLLAQIAELQKENENKGKTTQQSAKLKKEFQKASQGLTAVGWYVKATDLWKRGKPTDPQKVVEYSSESIRLDPNYARAYNARGVAYKVLKQLDRAIADFDKAISLDPNDAKAYNNRGNAYTNLEQFDRAMADHNQAIRLDPNYSDAYSSRGRAYYFLKQFDLAIADCNKAIQLDPDAGMPYGIRGVIYAEQKKSVEALTDFNIAIRLAPDDASTYSLRAVFWMELNQFDRAISDFNQAIRIDSNDKNAFYRRGEAYFNLDQYDNAISDFTQAIRIETNHADSYNARGAAYAMRKQFDRAISDFTQALRIDPNDKNAYKNRESAYDDLKKLSISQPGRVGN